MFFIEYTILHGHHIYVHTFWQGTRWSGFIRFPAFLWETRMGSAQE